MSLSIRHARAAAVWLVGIAVGAILLWISLRSVDVHAVLAIALRAEKKDLLGIVACGLIFIGLKAVRWGWLLRQLRQLPPGRLVGSVFAGTAANYGIPHSGELIRVWIVARQEGLPVAALLASIALERLFDSCAALLLGVAALLTGGEALDTLGTPLWVLLFFVVTILGALLPFAVWPTGALRASRSLLRPLPKAVSSSALRHLEHGVEGLGSLQQGSILVQALTISVVQWALMATCIWLSLCSVGVAPGPVQAVVTLLLLIVGLTLPAAPGQVGTTQVAFLLAAAPFGVGREEALAASIIYNVVLPVPLIVIGVGVFLKIRSRRD